MGPLSILKARYRPGLFSDLLIFFVGDLGRHRVMAS